MSKCLKKVLSLVLAAAMVMSMTACGKDPETPPEQYDVPALVQSIVNQVRFAEELSHSPDPSVAALYFPDLPEGAQVQLYTGSGYHADEVALITLRSDADMKAARASANAHIAQLRSQFQSYIPEEVGKIDKALVWEYDKYLLICISDDYASAKLIVEHGSDPNYKLPGTTEPSGTTTVPSGPSDTTGPSGTVQPTQPPVTTTPPTTMAPPVTTVPPVTHDPSVALRPDGYPAIISQSGKYVNLSSGIIRVDDRGFEQCGYSESVAATYASLVNKVAAALEGKTTVYALPIPTSFGIMLPDDIQALYPNYPNQGASIDNMLSKLSANIVPVRCFDNLMSHRNEYLYFRTDHHWNGIGAYYAYEAFCEAKGITPYTMDQREEKQFGGFRGTLYINGGKPAELYDPDTVYAYKPYSKSASMVFYDTKGTEIKWSIISDVTNYQEYNKYSTFAGADNPLAIFKNPEVTDGSVCVVVKESYGNALLPYLVDHYSTIYEIDYRYWTGDLAAYAQQVGADDLIFANNIMMISTSLLVGMLGKIVK